MELPAIPHRLGALLGALDLLVGLRPNAAIGRTPGVASVSEDGRGALLDTARAAAGNERHDAGGLARVPPSNAGRAARRWLVDRRLVADHALPADGRPGRRRAAPQRGIVDRFCLDGQRLVVVKAPATGAERRIPHGNRVLRAHPRGRRRLHQRAGLVHGRSGRRAHPRVRRDERLAHRRHRERPRMARAAGRSTASATARAM